jgi:drug/metabolite transporter (DMT)-like permease
MIGVLFVILASTLWAVDTLIRYPLLGEGINPLTVVIIEHAILSVAFLPLLFPIRKGKQRLSLMRGGKEHLFYFLMVGGVGSALATFAFTNAFSLINPSVVILLQKLQPVVTILLAYYLLKERVRREFIFWAVVCLVGGVLISFNDIQGGLQQLNRSSLLSGNGPKGVLFAMLAVIGWGSATVFGKKLSNAGRTNLEIMGGRFFTGFISLLLIAAVVQPSLSISLGGVGKIALMAALSGLLAMYLYYQGLKQISARVCSLAEMFFPFCAVIVNWWILDAKLTIMQLCGGGLLLLGSTVIQWRRY